MDEPEQETSRVKAPRKPRDKRKETADSAEAWQEAWFGLFMLIAAFRREKEIPKTEFKAMGENWHALQRQVPPLVIILNLMRPAMAIGGLIEKLRRFYPNFPQNLLRRKKAEPAEEPPALGPLG